MTTINNKQKRSDLEKYNKLILSDIDRDLFLELIRNPPEPNESLLKAMKQFEE